MTRPNIFVRFAGSPLGALMLFTVYAIVGIRWNQGEAPWWLALGCVGAALRTWRCIRHMRSYKRWCAEWRRMGEDDAPGSLPHKPRTYGLMYVLSLAMLLLIPLVMSQPHNEQQHVFLLLVWLAFGFGLALAISRRVLRRWKQRRQDKAESAPVSWMLGRASSSPSRKDACKALPAYVVPLLNTNPKLKSSKTIEGTAA